MSETLTIIMTDEVEKPLFYKTNSSSEFCLLQNVSETEEVTLFVILERNEGVGSDTENCKFTSIL